MDVKPSIPAQTSLVWCCYRRYRASRSESYNAVLWDLSFSTI